MAGVALAAMRAGLPAVTQRLLAIATAKKPVYGAEGKTIGEIYASPDSPVSCNRYAIQAWAAAGADVPSVNSLRIRRRSSAGIVVMTSV